MSLFIVGLIIGGGVVLAALLVVAFITERSDETHERGEDGL